MGTLIIFLLHLVS